MDVVGSGAARHRMRRQLPSALLLVIVGEHRQLRGVQEADVHRLRVAGGWVLISTAPTARFMT